ncbi:MAG: SIR2 family protein, partial [Thermomicrobiales bacterium]
MEAVSVHVERSLRILSADQFVRELHTHVTDGYSAAQYAFFIGAGCSISSGIPGARSLVRDRWLPKLQAILAPNEDDPIAWGRDSLGVDPDGLSADTYGRVMKALFTSPALRQNEIEHLCTAAKPGFGYATMAQLMVQSENRFNILLTTNFDDLVADALYLFTGSHPLQIQHGTLSPYIRATRTRPLIVKLHGHHQFSPLNTPEETQTIDQGIAGGVRNLLNDRGIIFIGYSGNDDGVRDVLDNLPPEALPYGVYWVSRLEPMGTLRKWLLDRSATWVQKLDFDELMLHFRDVFSLPMPSLDSVKAVFSHLDSDYIELSDRIHQRVPNDPQISALKEAADRVDRTVNDWAIYELRASRERKTDLNKARTVYEEGIRALPDSVPLIGNYANLLKDLGLFEEAEANYQRAISLSPDYPAILHDYAILLWRYLGRIEEAKSLLQRAMAIDKDSDPIRLVHYAQYFWELKSDSATALEYFKQSVSRPTRHSEPFRQFGAFAEIELHDYRLAEELYIQSLELQPDD